MLVEKKFTIWLIIFGFFIKEFSRTIILPNLTIISNYYFGVGIFHAFEISLLITFQMGGSSVACLIFGTLADRITRKKALIISLFFWDIGLILLTISINFYFLLIGELFLGIGSGGFIPVAQAIIGDAVSSQESGKTYGWTSNFVAIGFLFGILAGSFFSPYWKYPFLIASFLISILLFLYIFKGSQFKLGNNESGNVNNENRSTYSYKINWDSFIGILKNKTNILIFVEGIFSILGISIITTYLYPFLIESPSHLTPIIISILMLIFIFPSQLIGNYFWSRIGDFLERKYIKARILLIALEFTITTPFFIFIFWIPISPIISTDSLQLAFTNSSLMIFICLFSIGIFLSAIYDSNQPPIINKINLPETRGSVFAINRFVEELGGSLGPLLVGIFFEITGQNLSIAMTIGMLFMIPGIFCWWSILKTFSKDYKTVKSILMKRFNLS